MELHFKPTGLKKYDFGYSSRFRAMSDHKSIQAKGTRGALGKTIDHDGGEMNLTDSRASTKQSAG